VPDPEFSLARIVPILEKIYKRHFVFLPVTHGAEVEEALKALAPGDVLLLENVRFDRGEEEGDLEFARDLARPFDIFVNEAFSVSHRKHASVALVPLFLPSFAGFHLLKELKELDDTRLNPKHPAVAVIGGAKIETKLPLISALEPIYDCILVGGKIANEALDQKLTFSEKVLLPQDFDSENRFDIGPQTIAYYSSIVKKAKTVVWNGPMGKFEEKPYDMGTDTLLHAMVEGEGFVVIGGGESLSAAEHSGLMAKIGFVSSGGGAMLEYMSGKELPGISALENAKL
jgi:phosphoglycerate kinase